MQRIRPAIQALKIGLGIDHALASRRLYTDGAEPGQQMQRHVRCNCRMGFRLRNPLTGDVALEVGDEAFLECDDDADHVADGYDAKNLTGFIDHG